MGKRDNILIALSKIDGITLEIINQLPDNDDIELKKDFGEYSISLNLKKIEGDIWQLNGYYFDE